MEKSTSLRIIELLDNEKENIVSDWLNKAKVNKDDPFYEEIILNGHQMIKLVMMYIQTPNLDLISKLTDKVAKERVEANVNIGEFVFNIHIGRSIVNSTILNSTLPENIKLETVVNITEFFDFFVNEAVMKYTNIKDEIIKNKNLFIQEMHQDRLTILGQIAASFAHEFRNPLTVIQGFISLIERDIQADVESKQYFKIINNEMLSLQEKVNKFLYLSKMKILDDRMEAFNLSEVIHEMVDFMYPRFAEENINVITKVEEGLEFIGGVDQKKPVILNIILNAVEELQKLKEERSLNIKLMSKDPSKLVLTITNNGPAIPSHIQESIFEPFISTKELGTGLGLSVCKQIIGKHNGKIYVNSEKENTSFIIELMKST
jgi:signal transduction histidine kinase